MYSIAVHSAMIVEVPVEPDGIADGMNPENVYPVLLFVVQVGTTSQLSIV